LYEKIKGLQIMVQKLTGAYYGTKLTVRKLTGDYYGAEIDGYVLWNEIDSAKINR
jgi:hypothetical protein